MKIEIDKKYMTKSGELVRRVLCVDGLRNNYPVVVEMENGEIVIYTAEGVYDRTSHPSSMDLIEISEWADFKIDNKVMVRNNSDTYWHKRYFAGVNEEGKPTAFIKGANLWTSAGNHAIWDDCRRPTEEELNN